MKELDKRVVVYILEPSKRERRKQVLTTCHYVYIFFLISIRDVKEEGSFPLLLLFKLFDAKAERERKEFYFVL